MTFKSALLATTVVFALSGSAFAAGCDKVTFSDVGWTDITATTAVTSAIHMRSRFGSKSSKAAEARSN